jgi:hypothetical protein
MDEQGQAKGVVIDSISQFTAGEENDYGNYY